MNTEGLSEKSNIAHVKHNEELLINERDKRLFALRNKDNAEYLINKRTLDILAPFFNKRSTWLTVGDYNGFEAQYIAEHNQEVVASDIATHFLKVSQEEGFVQTISEENVEKLSFSDGKFDYTMCREAYHHFPKAYLGAYEMIRVANKAAIIIEPIDIIQKMPLLLWLKNIMDLVDPLFINKIWKNRFSFEAVGNYVFKISEREIEKMAMGIGLPCIAFKRINVVMENLGNGIRDVPCNMKTLKTFERKVAFKNILSKLHLSPYNTLCSVVFKQMPDQELLNNLKKNGYEVIPLPKNPYLK
jgi:ubiquinone/menaquinone biosynthesis C-methylase UbiE